MGITRKDWVWIYTDGSCYPNPGPGGWGFVLWCRGREREKYRGVRDTTNNRMEMTAAIRGLEMLTRPCNVVLFTDSQYLQKGVSQWMPKWRDRGWVNSNGESVKNRDLWERLDELNNTHIVHWKWVKGHSGHAYNERADYLAGLGRASVSEPG